MSFLACMTSIFHARQFYINSEHIWHILKAKKFNWFFTPFSPFFSTRPTSESYNDPLKVLTEGSMVEYLPVGSQEDPQTIIDKKNFEPWNPKSQSQPSVQCKAKYLMCNLLIFFKTDNSSPSSSTGGSTGNGSGGQSGGGGGGGGSAGPSLSHEQFRAALQVSTLMNTHPRKVT